MESEHSDRYHTDFTHRLGNSALAVSSVPISAHRRIRSVIAQTLYPQAAPPRKQVRHETNKNGPQWNRTAGHGMGRLTRESVTTANANPNITKRRSWCHCPRAILHSPKDKCRPRCYQVAAALSHGWASVSPRGGWGLLPATPGLGHPLGPGGGVLNCAPTNASVTHGVINLLPSLSRLGISFPVVVGNGCPQPGLPRP